MRGQAVASSNLGIGIAVLQIGPRNGSDARLLAMPDDLLPVLARLREVTSVPINTVTLLRGIKVFDGDRLYLVKPIGQRFWTETAALNDADEIAGAILMSASPSRA